MSETTIKNPPFNQVVRKMRDPNFRGVVVNKTTAEDYLSKRRFKKGAFKFSGLPLNNFSITCSFVKEVLITYADPVYEAPWFLWVGSLQLHSWPEFEFRMLMTVPNLLKGKQSVVVFHSYCCRRQLVRL